MDLVCFSSSVCVFEALIMSVCLCTGHRDCKMRLQWHVGYHVRCVWLWFVCVGVCGRASTAEGRHG